jgi:hypothetical protein
MTLPIVERLRSNVVPNPYALRREAADTIEELVGALRATLAAAKSLTFPGDAESAPILASADALLTKIGGDQ